MRSFNSQNTQSKVSIPTNNLQSLIPHMHVPPQEVWPFSTQQSFNYPLPFHGLSNRIDRKSQSPIDIFVHLRKAIPSSSLTWRELLRAWQPTSSTNMDMLNSPSNAHFPSMGLVTRHIGSRISLQLQFFTLGKQFPTILSPGENTYVPDNLLLRQTWA